MNFKPPKRSLLLAILLAAFAVMDFTPHKGRPYFRYTGSNPDRPVWHLGWPMPMAIYDDQAGPDADRSLFFAPHAAAVAVVQMLALVLLLRSTMQPNPPPDDEQPDEDRPDKSN